MFFEKSSVYEEKIAAKKQGKIGDFIGCFFDGIAFIYMLRTAC